MDIDRKNNMYTKGHIILAVTKEPFWLGSQDYENKTIIDSQFPKQKLFQKKPKSTPLPIYLDKSLVDIVATNDTESLITYVKSVLYKIFPDQTISNKLDNQEFTYENIFGSHGYGQRPYEYACGLLPYDSLHQKELTYEVAYLTENKTGVFLSISWEENFESIDSGWLTVSNLTTFAKQMFYTLSESPFFSEAFTIMPDESYVEDIDTYGNRQTLKLLDRHFVADVEAIKTQIDSITPIDWDKEYGDLIPLDEMGSFINYDGHGYYCKQKGDTTYKSSISYNADCGAPKMLREAFTHVLWYNR